jgi:predicted RNase H-like nuclease (RuvC/YqgF family)
MTLLNDEQRVKGALDTIISLHEAGASLADESAKLEEQNEALHALLQSAAQHSMEQDQTLREHHEATRRSISALTLSIHHKDSLIDALTTALRQANEAFAAAGSPTFNVPTEDELFPAEGESNG